MDWIVSFLQKNPLIPLFLTLGLGFWLGKVKIKSFALGSVAATLVVGVVIGQMKIMVPDILKNVFFLFFLFSIGYSVGPQFFRVFKGGPGLRMALFSVVMALVCAGMVIGASALMGYSTGIAAGLFAGSQTVSASLGLLSDTVREMPLDDDTRAKILMLIPACYAVTYVFGTIGTSWFLSTVGPRLMGGIDKVKAEVARIEQSMDSRAVVASPGIIPAMRPVVFRAYCVGRGYFDMQHTVADIEAHYAENDVRVAVERLSSAGATVVPSPETVVKPGDIVVLGGRSADMAGLAPAPGEEIYDDAILNFGAERTPVTIASRDVDGITLGELRTKPFMERVLVSSVTRNGLGVPVRSGLELHAGDVVTLVGWPRDVASASASIGYADKDSDSTDMVFVGLGIAAGCVLGALTIHVNGIPLALGTSVGALVSGLTLGWLRTRKPSFGHIPSSALWIFNNLGINMFIAVLGLSAGAALSHGIREAGLWIVLVGAILTILSTLAGVLVGRRLFRFNMPETLGCVAGARCCVAAIGAVQNSLGSDVPNLGYTVTYAVANVTLVFAGLAVLFII